MGEMMFRKDLGHCYYRGEYIISDDSIALDGSINCNSNGICFNLLPSGYGSLECPGFEYDGEFEVFDNVSYFHGIGKKRWIFNKEKPEESLKSEGNYYYGQWSKGTQE